MFYCNIGEEAKVIYTSKLGVKTQFITKNTPIDVECSDKQRTGKFIYTLKDFGYSGNCESSGTEYTDIIIADTYTLNSTSVGGQFANCPWYQVTFLIGASQVFSAAKTSRYSVTQIPNPNYSPGGKTLVIKNAQGNKLFEAEVKDCNYNVICGDNCPPEHIKCNCDAYPGYCCVPCAEIRDGVAAARAELRSK